MWDVDGTGGLYVSRPERDAFFAFEDIGGGSDPQRRNYTFGLQRLRPEERGHAIDFVYASPALAELVTGAEIDRDERKGKGASDHVPVIVEFDL